MCTPVPVPAPLPPNDFGLAIERLRALTIISDSGTLCFKGSANTQFSEMDCAFVPSGQSDTDVRDELRSRLKSSDVAPIVEAIWTSFDRRRAAYAEDRQPAGWSFLDYPDAAGRAAIEAGLAPRLAYWLRLTAFCLVVARGPAGAALPPLPRTPDEESRPPEQRPPCIQLPFVPGDEPRCWFGDDGENGSGLPDAEHDPDDPKSTGWRA
jgi:hypothetical protein